MEDGGSNAAPPGGSQTEGLGAAAGSAAEGDKAPRPGSPNTVTALGAAAADSSPHSSVPTSPVAEDSCTVTSGGGSTGSAGHTAGASASPHLLSPPLSRCNSQSQGRSHGSAADLQAVSAQAAAAARRQESRHLLQAGGSSFSSSGSGGRAAAVDVPALVARLKQRPLTGQVVAWGWQAAAALSAVRRTMPAQLFSGLWPATEACAWRMMPQDVLEVLESWLTLMQQCPRHFRLSRVVLQQLTTYALPAAVKRMGEDQLAQLAQLARDIALHRNDIDIQASSVTQQGASARDLMQPVFALAAAEAAWRCSNPARYVSPETVSAVVTAAPAWSWRVVQHRDSQALASLKIATAAALEELVPHSPRDLPPSAFGKLKTDGVSPRKAAAAGAGPQQQS